VPEVVSACSADPADPSDFPAVDSSGDPAAMIALMDMLAPLHRAPKSLLLDRLAPETARAALDVGCGPGTDTVELARRMPPGSRVEGVDISEAMLAEARRRALAAGADVIFRAGDASRLPYGGASFDICRVKTVLQHVGDPLRVIREMRRVTRPGGRVGALELDLSAVVIDYPDRTVTRTITGAFDAAIAQPWAGRQLQRLFREAGLAGVAVDPVAYTVDHRAVRAIFGPVVTRLRGQGALTPAQADDWWSWLDRQDAAGGYTCAGTVFVVTGTRT
jgi:ubiquinone/menaquinone biosynthesis C-methylase UbiE